jgi:hypothetical protein
MTKEEILQIAEDYQKTVQQRLDELLEADSNMYTNLGIDSTKTEKEEVRRASRVIYRAIRDNVDENIGKELLQHQDGY